MIPASFDYHAPGSLPEALALLSKYGDEAKVLSGGQSLLPLLKLRLGQTGHLIDIGRIPGLEYVREDGGMDYLVPTAMETPAWETGKTVTPSPHHPFGAKGVGESATVGATPAIANAVVDALSHLGVRHIDIPITPERVWRILKDKGVAE